MSYVGSAPSPSVVQFSTLDAQSFNGDNSTTAFTLNRAVSIAASIEVTVNNVQQSPYDGSYTVNGTTTLTFSEAPSSGTDNIYVRFLDYPLASITPGDGTVGLDQLSATGTPSSSTYLRGDNSWAAIASSQWTTTGSNIYYNTGNVGIGTSSFSANGLLTLNRAPTAAFGSPILQIGGSSYTSGGYYSVGLGFTDATYTEPPAEIAYVATSDSGGTKGAIVFGNRDVTTNTAVTERMRIDSSGNVGIGTSSPSGKLTVSGGDVRIDTDDKGVIWGNNGIFGNNASDYITIKTVDAERMRIDSSGNLMVGTTSAQNTASGRGNFTLNGSSAGAIMNWSSGGTNKSYSFQDGTNWSFYNNVNGGNIDITAWSAGVRLSSGGTSWSSLSDERKKDIIEPIENAVEKVVTLRAVIGKYKTDEEGTRRSFLIAQDVQAVLPEAVDAQDSEQLGLRYTETIPLLVAAIKELKALSDTQAQTIEALTARIAALESNNGTL